MTDHLKVLFDHLRHADQSLADQELSIEEVRAQRRDAHDALWTAIEAELDATTEQTDLRESVQRLEHLIMEQGTQLRELRARLDGRDQ